MSTLAKFTKRAAVIGATVLLGAGIAAGSANASDGDKQADTTGTAAVATTPAHDGPQDTYTPAKPTTAPAQATYTPSAPTAPAGDEAAHTTGGDRAN